MPMYFLVNLEEVFVDPMCFQHSRYALHEKGLRRQKSRSTGQQPRTKSISLPAVTPDISRLSTVDFVPAFDSQRISLVRASGETLRQRFDSGRRGWLGRDAVGSIRENPPSCPPANRRHCPGRLFGSANKRNPM